MAQSDRLRTTHRIVFYTIAAFTTLCTAAPAAPLPNSDDAPIIGGRAALARAIGLESVPDRPRFVAELTRVIYDTPEGRSATTDALLQRLSEHLEVVGRFQSALAVVQPGDSGISLAMADGKADRDRLKDFLDLVGLRLREKNKAFTVERSDNKQAADRLKRLSDLGIDLTQLAARLNKGETVRVDVPTETVPVPLTARVWGAAVFHKAVPLPALFAAIIGDRQAALLCHGLAALDDDTLAYLAERPAIVTRLYEHDAPAFAAFGDALRIRGGSVVPPGGAAAAPLWEPAVGEALNRPERFVRELFAQNDGRVAYAYDSIAHLDPARATFAVGAWIKDAGVRADRFKALVSQVSGETKEWDVRTRPFGRPPNDAPMLLARMRVEADGSPAPPFWRLFWERALDGPDLPGEPARQLRNLQQDGPIDAAWFIERLGETPTGRGERLDQLSFAQRLFGSAPEADLPNVLVAVRALPRYRMLMLTLDRIGVRSPALYADAARTAQRFSDLNANRAFAALGQFQGALAVLTRLSKVRALDRPRAEALVKSLLAVRLTDEGRYAGGVARWVQADLGPAIGLAPDVDASLARALSGARSASPEVATVVWEDQAYRVDLAGPEERRLIAARDRLGAPPLNVALALERVAARLAAPSVSLDEVKAAAAELKPLVAAFPAPKKGDKESAVLPPGVDEPRSGREVVNRALQDLSKLSTPKDAGRAERTARPLLELSDALMADSLMSLAYALDLGDPDGPLLVAGNVGHRHDFGFLDKGEEKLREPWAAPRPDTGQPGVPWHVRGSLLGLDVALAPMTLHRIASDNARPPVLVGGERDAFASTVALLDPRAMRDEDRDAIAGAVERGRARVAALRDHPETLDTVASEIVMDGWRRRAVAWSIASDPAGVPSFFALEDLLRLGGADPAGLNAWGMPAVTSDACLCTRMAAPGQWPLFVGRPQLGVLPTQVDDLNLRAALVLHDHRLPAVLAPGVLTSALADYVDQVRPIDSNDWLTLVRTAQGITPERMEDYIAALTASGPLVPAADAQRGAR